MSESVLNTIDLAWGKFVLHRLPPPKKDRLLTRSDVGAEITEFFRKFYGIAEDVRVRTEYANIDSPAHVLIRKKDYLIRVDEKYKGWHDAEAAMLAHEMVHVLMAEIGVEGRNRLEDEIFTDSFAVFLGTALISNFNTSVDFYKDGAWVNRMGYLDRGSRLYSMARFVTEASIEIPRQASGSWRAADLGGLELSAKTLLKRRAMAARPPKKTPGGWACQRCGSSLDIQGNTLSCPECGSSHLKRWLGFKSVVC